MSEVVSGSVAQCWPWDSQMTSNNNKNLTLNQKSQNNYFGEHRNQIAILMVCITKYIKRDNKCGTLLRNIICREISSEDLVQFNFHVLKLEQNFLFTKSFFESFPFD